MDVWRCAHKFAAEKYCATRFSDGAGRAARARGGALLLLGREMLAVGFATLVLVGFVAVPLVILLTAPGPHGRRPDGWAPGVESSKPIRTALIRGKRIEVRPASWEQRFEIAALVALAHSYTGAFVRLFHSIAPASRRMREYAPTLAERAKLPAKDAIRDGAEFVTEASNRAARVRGTAWVLQRALSLLPDNRNLLVATDAETRCVVGYVQLVRPGRLTLSAQLRVGLLEFPLRWGLAAFAQLLRMPRALDALEEEVCEAYRGEYLRLERVSVSPELQGAGLGRFLLAIASERLDAQGMACFLHTQSERTVRWYEEAGWKVVGDSPRELNAQSDYAWKDWMMWRQAPASAPRPSSS